MLVRFHQITIDLNKYQCARSRILRHKPKILLNSWHFLQQISRQCLKVSKWCDISHLVTTLQKMNSMNKKRKKNIYINIKKCRQLYSRLQVVNGHVQVSLNWLHENTIHSFMQFSSLPFRMCSLISFTDDGARDEVSASSITILLPNKYINKIKIPIKR